MITITQDLPSLYPAFNDAYIKFTTDLSNPQKADIIFSDSSIFPDPFVIFPSPSGEFVFNFKEMAKASFDNPEFNHGSGEVTGWGRSFSDNKATVSVTIKTYNSSTNDSLSKTYTFYKSVVQIGEPLTDGYLLESSSNGVDYRLKYWEGFPFSFQIKDLANATDITVKNKNSDLTSTAITTTEAGAFEVNADLGNTNWTSSNFLPLHNIKNNLEIYEEGVFKANLQIDKVEPCSGRYLRWFNENGGFTYWLFDEYYRDTLQTRSGGRVATNSFLNAGSAPAPFVEFGKTGSKSLRLKTKVNKYLQKTFESIYKSPKIELYSSQTPYIAGSWQDVSLEGSISSNNKRDLEEYSLTFELSNPLTMTR